MDDKDLNLENNVGKLTPIDVEDELKRSFISYAMAVIVTRALPDVRDGLKPVHRRILYSMMELGVTPDKPYRKSARIVGDCLGKYHPHGDTSVYDAMVRLAQDFTIRCPLVDGQGNFGSVDGDGAAAMRYTEARLTKLAMEMVADLDKQTVDFYPNFDETLMQPSVMPSRFPNLLVNGSSGIAVGMATNIPPHNLGEVIDGVCYMIDEPDATGEDLMRFIKGPDFPTGGIIHGKRGIYDAYMTGRGRIITRARSEFEEMGSNRQRIVVTEIPYMVNKAKLIEKIADLIHDKKIDGISDIRDESDRQGMRIAIDLKRDVNPTVVLNQLYRHTQMQDTFSVNMLALVDGEPKVLSLRQAVHHYIEHQIDVVTRRTRYDLEKAEARAHILEGLLIALDRIDEVISIIRSSRTDTIARERLMQELELTDKQAQAILDMRLRRLTGLERDKLQAEYDELLKTIAYLKSLLEDDKLLRGVIKDELIEIKRKYADPRRTEIVSEADDIDMIDLVQEEDVVVTLTHNGYIKRLSRDNFRQQKRGGKGITGAQAKDEDFVERMYVVSTHDTIICFTDRGRAFKLYGYQIPEASRIARGTAAINIVQLDPGEKITVMLPAPLDDPEGKYLVMATEQGVIKRVELSDFANIRKNGLIAVNLREDDRLINVALTSGQSDIFIGTMYGMAVRFDENDVRSMGRQATGVRAIRLAEGDKVISMGVTDEDGLILCVSEKGYGKRTRVSEYSKHSRGGKGNKAMKLTDKTGRLASMMIVDGERDLLLVTDDGIVIRTHVDSVPIQARSTQGVRIMRVAEGRAVISVTTTDAEEDRDDDTAQNVSADTDTAIQADALDTLLEDLENDPEPDENNERE